MIEERLIWRCLSMLIIAMCMCRIGGLIGPLWIKNCLGTSSRLCCWNRSWCTSIERMDWLVERQRLSLCFILRIGLKTKLLQKDKLEWFLANQTPLLMKDSLEHTFRPKSCPKHLCSMHCSTQLLMYLAKSKSCPKGNMLSFKWFCKIRLLMTCH